MAAALRGGPVTIFAGEVAVPKVSSLAEPFRRRRDEVLAGRGAGVRALATGKRAQPEPAERVPASGTR